MTTNFSIPINQYYLVYIMNSSRHNQIRKINNILLLSLILIRRKLRNKKRSRRFWVRDIFKARKLQGAYYHLLEEMKLDNEKYFNYLRMSYKTFNILLGMIQHNLKKHYCVREPISPGERLSVTLRYLASGDSMMSISYAFRIAHSTVSKIISEICEAIWSCFHQQMLPKPDEDTRRDIAEGFNEKWQLPNCIGAIDGKHVVIQAPPKSGSTYYNYKGSHSIVLTALCDAKYKFVMVDIGAEGRHSDGGIFKNSNIGKLIATNNLSIPPPSILCDNGEAINFYICGDEAFPLSTCLMRPYPGRFLPQIKRIFNYRLSRGRRTIENSFGILAARWRIYRKPIIAQEKTVCSIVKATVCLHNFLIDTEKKYLTATLVDREDSEGHHIQGDWRNNDIANLNNVRRTSTNMYGRAAEDMRNKLATYFSNEGAVPFQWGK